MKKAVQFGAGNIGRGFLGDLFSNSGYRVIFVEVDERMVKELKRRNWYDIEIAKLPKERRRIKNVTAVNARNTKEVLEKCWDADIFSTSVGKNNLSKISPHLANIIKKRKEEKLNKYFNLIIAENVSHGSKLVKELIYRELSSEEKEFAEKFFGLVEAVIARMVPFVEPEIKEKDPLFVRMEEYSLLPVDRKKFKGELPEIDGFVPVDDIEDLEARKLYMHNLGHAMFSYLGYIKRYKFIHEVIEDSWIREKAIQVFKECEKGLAEDYNFHILSLREHREDLLRRFSNRELKDTVVRVSRDPIRKLSPGERLVGGARFIEKHKGNLEGISWGIAGALLYDYERDKEAVKLQKLIREEGLSKVFSEILGISPEEKIGILVKEKLKALEKIKI